jgi:hypothetical protein
MLHVGDVPAGTVFRATASDGEQSVSATSDPYQGPLHVTEPPSVQGPLRVGRIVRAVAGQWSGGWGGEQPYLQLQACRTREAGCKVIASTFWWEHCGGVAARISKRYAGWFLRVGESRSGRQPVYATFLPLRAEDLKPLAPSGNKSVRTVGRIRPGRGARGGC